MSLTLVLLTQACSDSNAPFLPTYDVELDITDPAAKTLDKAIKGHLTRGTTELVTEVSTCEVQIHLGQCISAEQIWITFKAKPNNPSCRGNTCKCEPSVWSRVQKAAGRTVLPAQSEESTRSGNGFTVHVLAGPMEDGGDSNSVVDLHSDENRIATAPLTTGRIDVYKATNPSPIYGDSVVYQGEFFADIDVAGPGIGSVKGRLDAVVDATDGMPVGPRCGWAVLSEDN
ncbi:MAG: hypothetical protein AB2A00_42595 [Myxococcota bacterium]